MAGTGPTYPNFDASAAIAEREKMRAKAKAEGAKILEIPTADTEGARRQGTLSAVDVGKVAEEIASEADALRTAHPEIEDDTFIRAAIVTRRGEGFADFIKAYPAVFHNFTSRDCQGDMRERMLRTIVVKARLERGELKPDDAHNLLSDLFGVDEAKRKEIRREIEKMSAAEKRKQRR